ncbi:uncharacterized protein LOC134543296 [Bacillus rossius redtenbacheri]|uniref:uncharacterized protein LOC134543296 n=1 Tax=Bacillus rossius redtenbacheri TaxID=93214 RepID=UPI002FDD3675
MASGSNEVFERQQIRYSCVSNGEFILVSHQTEPENYCPMVYSIIRDLDRQGMRKLTFPVDKFQMHVLVDGGLVFACVTYATSQHFVPFTFLETVRRQFCDVPSLVARSPHAREYEFDRDFAPVLSSIVYEFNVGRGDQVSRLQAQVDDVKRIMLDNVEKVIQRGENLDDLLSKTESLESVGSAFRQRTREVYLKARCQNLKMWLVIGSLVAGVLTVAVLVIVGVIRM